MTTQEHIYISRIEELFQKIRPSDLSPNGACLIWTFATIAVLTQEKIRAIIQAGTCLWPRVRREQDDGICSTHFGYQWSPLDPASKLMVSMGKMPEIHIWAAIPKTQTIIDLSIRTFPQQCEEIIKQDWPGDIPPQYLWCHTNDLPDGVMYKPEVGAIVYAANAMQKFIEEDVCPDQMERKIVNG